jgi:hypothetical protein
VSKEKSSGYVHFVLLLLLRLCLAIHLEHWVREEETKVLRKKQRVPIPPFGGWVLFLPFVLIHLISLGNDVK